VQLNTHLCKVRGVLVSNIKTAMNEVYLAKMRKTLYHYDGRISTTKAKAYFKQGAPEAKLLVLPEVFMMIRYHVQMCCSHVWPSRQSV